MFSSAGRAGGRRQAAGSGRTDGGHAPHAYERAAKEAKGGARAATNATGWGVLRRRGRRRRPKTRSRGRREAVAGPSRAGGGRKTACERLVRDSGTARIETARGGCAPTAPPRVRVDGPHGPATRVRALALDTAARTGLAQGSGSTGGPHGPAIWGEPRAGALDERQPTGSMPNLAGATQRSISAPISQ